MVADEGVSKVFAQSVLMYVVWGRLEMQKTSRGRLLQLRKCCFKTFQQAEERSADTRPSLDQYHVAVNWNSRFCNLQQPKPIYFGSSHKSAG